MTQKLVDEIISHLEMIIEDAEMALDGRWDCCTDEGKDGFNAQINLTEDLLNKVKEYGRKRFK